MADFIGQFNWVDWVFIAVFILSVLAGIVKGLVREVLALLVMVAAFVIAIIFAHSLANYFVQSGSNGGSETQAMSYLAIGISFGVLFIGTLIIGAILSFFLSLLFSAGVLGIGNRLLGGLFGFVRGFIINLVIVFVVQLTAFGDSNTWKHSKLVEMFQPSAAWLSGVVSPTLEDLKAKFTKGASEAAQSATQSVEHNLEPLAQPASAPAGAPVSEPAPSSTSTTP